MAIVVTKNDFINFETPQAVACSVLFWRCAYVVVKLLFLNKSPEYHSRIMSFFHGLITAFLGINQCFKPDSPFYYPEWKTTYMQSFILTFSSGYFIHDLIWCLKHQLKDKLMIFHHCYSSLFLLRTLYKGYSGAQCTCGLGYLELTNPFLQIRWFLRAEGVYPSLIFLAAETSFMMVYVVVRILLGSYVMWLVLSQPKNDWEFIISAWIIYCISWMFFINMIKYAFYKYSNPIQIKTN